MANDTVSQSDAALPSKEKASVKSPATSVLPVLLPIALVLMAGVSLLKLASLFRNRGSSGCGKDGSDGRGGSGHTPNGSLVEKLFGRALEEARAWKQKQEEGVEEDGDKEFQEVEGDEEEEEDEEWEEDEEEKSSWNRSVLEELKAANARMAGPAKDDEE